MAISILEFVLVLGLLILLHELGHFILARIFNIPVEEFGLGLPPRIVRLFTWGGTEFTLNWIPFGGFVRPRGENDPDVPGGLAAANPWKRFAVLMGGSTVNILTGIVLFTWLFTMVGAPDTSKIQIVGVSPASPAEQVGLQEGDVILKVNGQAITTTGDLSNLIQSNLGKPVTIQVSRGGQIVEFEAVPRVDPPPDQGALGIMMGNPVRQLSWVESVPIAFQVTYEQFYQLVTLPGRLAQGTISPEEGRVVGPIGMFSIYDQMRERDIEGTTQAPGNVNVLILNRLFLVATISVALGLTNLLPIPALDGGRILFLLPEILFRRRIPPKYESLVHAIGFMLLIGLMIFIARRDIIQPIQVP
ncbi:MAG TPA: M50 family metallopeptidase [Anaerolineaceae bacterium]|nr:M50 family metallopeptidase [Anaerolineaceae bacterium]